MPPEMDPQPEILLMDLSGRSPALDLTRLRQLGRRALPLVALQQTEQSVLPGLAQVEVTLVDDATITRVHEEFMGCCQPTDVITFHHGEILISIDTAERQAADYHRSLGEEVALYLIHGLLHLAGFKDKSPNAFQHMARAQEDILCQCLQET